eukprot:UN21927
MERFFEKTGITRSQLWGFQDVGTQCTIWNAQLFPKIELGTKDVNKQRAYITWMQDLFQMYAELT